MTNLPLGPSASIEAPPLRSGAMARYAALHAPETEAGNVLRRIRVHLYSICSREDATPGERLARDIVSGELMAQRAALRRGHAMAPLGEPGALAGICF